MIVHVLLIVVSIDQSIYPEHQSMIVHVLLIVVSIDQSIYPEHQPMIVLLIVVHLFGVLYVYMIYYL